MLIKASNVIGLKVVSLQKGETIEDVNDVIYDPQSQKVQALLVDPGGWFSEAKVIPLREIKSLGKDAVTVESSRVIKKASDLPKPNSGISSRNSKLKKMSVLTAGGTSLGRVSDVLFDPKSGDIGEYEISQGTVEDVKSGRKFLPALEVIKIGVDDILVKDEAFDKISQQGKEGGLKKTEEVKKGTTNLKESLRSTYDKLRSDMTLSRKKEAVGQYLTKTVLLPNDQILAKRGDLISNDIINKAEENGLLSQVLDNTSRDPVLSSEAK